MTKLYHTPVLLQETLTYLLTRTDGVYVDATLGGGGHAEALLDRLDSKGILVGLDADADAMESASKRLSGFGGRAILRRENFNRIKSALSDLKITGISGVLFDLGVSSFQLDEPSKGFSFRTDDMLDMRMDVRQRKTAADVVNNYQEAELADILWKYGEERHSRRIAKEVIRRRKARRVERTGELAEIVQAIVGPRFGQKSLARIFQALRIEVNQELENLKSALHDAFELLETGGRVVAISYHSLEDRIVKESMRQGASSKIPSGSKILPDTVIEPFLKILTKKPVVAGNEEVRANSRSRSAKLRAAEKL